MGAPLFHVFFNYFILVFMYFFNPLTDLTLTLTKGFYCSISAVHCSVFFLLILLMSAEVPNQCFVVQGTISFLSPAMKCVF